MLLLAVSRLLQLALVVASIKIATTLMPPSEIARVYLITSLFSISALLFINPVGMFINRRLNVWNANGTVRSHFGLFWLYVVAVGLVVYLLLAAIASTQILPFPPDGLLAAVVASMLVSATFNQTVVPGLNLLGRRNWFNLLTVLTGTMGLLVSVWAILHFSRKAEFWQFGVICGNFIVAIWGCKLFYNNLSVRCEPTRLTKTHLATVAAFALPIAATVSLGWVQSQSYRFIMQSLLGLRELGLFAAGYGISVGLISAFESIFTAYLYPRFYKQISNHDHLVQSEAWNDYAQAIFPSLVLVGALILSTAPELARTMLGPEFHSAYEYVGWGVGAELARVGAAVYAMVAHARMKTRLLLVPALVGAGLSLALIAWWLPLFASNGIGAALMLSSVAVFVLTLLATRGQLTTKFPLGRLMKGVAMGLGLFGLSEFLRWMAFETGIVTTLLHLGMVGLVFGGLQFVLLKPVIKIGEKS